jgi:hypothetical protein
LPSPSETSFAEVSMAMLPLVSTQFATSPPIFATLAQSPRPV